MPIRPIFRFLYKPVQHATVKVVKPLQYLLLNSPVDFWPNGPSKGMGSPLKAQRIHFRSGNHLPVVKFLPVTLFRELGSGFLIAVCVSKRCPVTRLWSWKLFRKPALNVHWKKLTNESKGKPEQKFEAAFGTIFRTSKCYCITASGS